LLIIPCLSRLEILTSVIPLRKESLKQLNIFAILGVFLDDRSSKVSTFPELPILFQRITDRGANRQTCYDEASIDYRGEILMNRLPFMCSRTAAGLLNISIRGLTLCMSVFLCSGCSTWSKLDETERGAIIGTGAGAAIGGVKGGSTGVLIGGAAGGLAGGLIGQELEKRPEPKDEDDE
jgi:hypothetical protein